MMMSAGAETSNLTQERRHAEASPGLARLWLLLLVAAAIAAGAVATGTAAATQAVADAGMELTRLLRAMAVLKASLAVGVVAAVLWRLGSPVTPARFAGYALACGAMGAGPAVIWSMAHIGAGAFMVHAGLLVALLLLWRDPTVAERLAAVVATRRATLNSRM
jgi:hypothetical protein